LQPHEVLGVRPDASGGDVTEAFRRFALRHHPDRGGNPQTFQAGVDAYRRLNGRQAAPGNVTFYRRRTVAIPSLVLAATRRLAALRPRP
jgi:hypothetical protein